MTEQLLARSALIADERNIELEIGKAVAGINKLLTGPEQELQARADDIVRSILTAGGGAQQSRAAIEKTRLSKYEAREIAAAVKGADGAVRGGQRLRSRVEGMLNRIRRTDETCRARTGGRYSYLERSAQEKRDEEQRFLQQLLDRVTQVLEGATKRCAFAMDVISGNRDGALVAALIPRGILHPIMRGADASITPAGVPRILPGPPSPAGSWVCREVARENGVERYFKENGQSITWRHPWSPR